MDSTFTFVVPPRPPSRQSLRYRSWDQVRAQVSVLYESHGLDQVIAIMETKYGFSRTKKQYKTQIARWGLDKKHIKAVEYKAMLKQKRRLKELQNSDQITFFLHGHEVPDSKIVRFEQRMTKAGKIQDSDTFEEIGTPSDLTWQCSSLPQESLPPTEENPLTGLDDMIIEDLAASISSPVEALPLNAPIDDAPAPGTIADVPINERHEPVETGVPQSRYISGTAYDLRSHTASNLFGDFGGRSHNPDGSNDLEVDLVQDPTPSMTPADQPRGNMPRPPYDLWSVFLFDDIHFTVDRNEQYKQSTELRGWFKWLFELLGEEPEWYQNAEIYSQVATVCWNFISGCLMIRDPKYKSDPTYLLNFHVTNLQNHLQIYLQSPKITRKHLSNLFVQTLVKLYLLFLPKGPNLNLTERVSDVIRVEIKNGTAGQNHAIFDSLVGMRENFIMGRCLLEVLIYVGQILFYGGLQSGNSDSPVDESLIALYESFKQLLPSFKELPIPVRFNYGGFEFWDDEQGWFKVGLS